MVRYGSSERMSIALFGGTFDPIHIGHVRGLIEAKEILCPRQMIIVPAGNPPHKEGEHHSPPEDRVKMVSLVTEELGFGKVSPFEIEMQGPSYTIRSLTHFAKISGGSPLILLIGSDSLLEIGSWHRYDEILSMTHIGVIPRPGFLTEKWLEEIEGAIDPLRITSVKRNYPSSRCDTITTREGTTITLLKIRRIHISSTEIREKVKKGASIKFLVTERVEQYIIENKLYREV